MFAGIDACGGGWVVVIAEGPRPLRLIHAAVHGTFAAAMACVSTASAVAVDIPIGLMD